MCCEEHHICTHCNQIITSTTDRCFAWRTGSGAVDYRNPGTEFGSGACPDGEEIVEEFYHDDDGFYCPNCSSSSSFSSPATARNADGYRTMMDRPRPPPIDPLSGEEVVAVVAMDRDSSPTSGEGRRGAAAARTAANAKAASGGGSWRLRVRKMVSGTTRLAGAGKRDEADEADEVDDGGLREADKRGAKTTVTSGPSSLL
ncbi:hypothetical protein SLS58_008564 [Diplodia intermedia]|uniref:Uncharacterized protein n=1 Tax=Diplodia intermedia TaxID=856260 RepID=A0ABR3THK7_9PEZI